MRYGLPEGLEYPSVESLRCTITQAEAHYFTLLYLSVVLITQHGKTEDHLNVAFLSRSIPRCYHHGLDSTPSSTLKWKESKYYLSCIILSGKITSQTATDSGVQDLLKQNGLTLICPLQSSL